MPVSKTYLDTWTVKNTTRRPITLGDLVNVLIPAGGTVDLLKQPMVTKEKINQSQHLQIAVQKGWLTILKTDQTHRPKREKQAILDDIDLDVNNPLQEDFNINEHDLYNTDTITFDTEYNNGTTTGLTFTINWNNGQKQRITLGGACTFAFVAPRGPANFLLRAMNFGNFNPVWPINLLWAGAAEPAWTPNGTDIIGFYYDGNQYYGAANLNFA